MKVHWNIEQSSEEWLRLRYRKIGGTSAKELLKYTGNLMIFLLAEHLEEFQLEETYLSDDMLRGIELEPEALRRLNEYLSARNITLLDCGYLESEENKLVGFSPDGISEDLKYMAEIKCPAKKKHTETIFYDCIPDDNLAQCVYPFLVNEKLESMFFLSFRPESKKSMFVKEITRQTIVNIGTDSKPKNISVQGAVDFMLYNLAILEKDLNQAIEKLNF